MTRTAAAILATMHVKPKKYRISGRCGGGNLGVTRKVRVLAPL